MKQVVQYLPNKDQFIIIGLSAEIIPFDHPSEYVTNGKWCRTSRVVSIDKETDSFETMNTKYVVFSGEKK